MMIVKKIVVRGRVQGIGYRPFVAEMAEELNICGWVRNNGGIVDIVASGHPADLETFEAGLKDRAPVGSLVTDISVEMIESTEHFSDFSIIFSEKEQTDRLPLIPADLPTCDRCAKEMHDSANRRYRHPFISCTACGPRYSIIERIPYDRESITMKMFDMCPACEGEYLSQGNIRRHAQTIACPECGPRLSLQQIGRTAIEGNEQSLEQAVEILRAGGIIAVKDIGGYHLVASPFMADTVRALRTIKGRERKPFAVCFNSVDSVKEYCYVDSMEEELLKHEARPIVLVKARRDVEGFDQAVCFSSPDIGAMLPCNPVQIMLTEAIGPLIMTSANVSGELMTIDNTSMIDWMESAREKCQGQVELGVLSHDRPIITPLDDSVVRIVGGKRQTLRRARGFVPEPIPFPGDKQVFAAGGDLKACFCYTGDGRAYLSQHLGDLFEESCYECYVSEKTRMKDIFGFEPKRCISDMHPAYRSLGQGLHVQHHRAHVASVMAEHNIKGPVLGFAFDGTGYGDDGSIWGSEVFFVQDGSSVAQMARVAHLAPVTLIGGDEGARNADTIMHGYLHNMNMSSVRDNANSQLIGKAVSMGINTVTSSSMGRLFDGASAFLDICHYNSYEGEAPIELENCAALTDSYYELQFKLEKGEDGCLWISPNSVFAGMQEALEKQIPVSQIARGFIYALSNVIVEIAEKTVDKDTSIVLSGGTFLNRILLERTTMVLEKKGYKVYRNELVPPGDGGLCLGQAYIACFARES